METMIRKHVLCSITMIELRLLASQEVGQERNSLGMACVLKAIDKFI